MSTESSVTGSLDDTEWKRHVRQLIDNVREFAAMSGLADYFYAPKKSIHYTDVRDDVPMSPKPKRYMCEGYGNIPCCEDSITPLCPDHAVECVDVENEYLTKE